MTFLTHFDYGKQSRLYDGQTLGEYELVALDQAIEVARGLKFPAWTFNGTVPGPTLRATEGDLMRVHFRNGCHLSLYSTRPRAHRHCACAH